MMTCCVLSEVDGAGQAAGEVVVEVPPKIDAVSTPPAPPSSSSSTSRIPRLTSSLRRHLPVLAGLRHDRKPPCTAAATTPAATITIGTVQPATPPSSKVSETSELRRLYLTSRSQFIKKCWHFPHTYISSKSHLSNFKTFENRIKLS